MEDYNQPRSAKIKLAILMIIIFVIGMLMIATSKKARADEIARVALRGTYQLDKIVVTDTLGNEFEPSWKEFELATPTNPEYAIQVDVYSKGSFRTFEPTYHVGEYVRAPEFKRQISSNHYRVVFYVGLMSTWVDTQFRYKRNRAKLDAMLGMNGEIKQEVTDDEVLTRK